MKSTKHFLSAAISIALALTFFACTSDGGGGNGGDNTIDNGGDSSSNGNSGGGGSCEIKDYRTVKIGQRGWRRI